MKKIDNLRDTNKEIDDKETEMKKIDNKRQFNEENYYLRDLPERPEQAADTFQSREEAVSPLTSSPPLSLNKRMNE